MRVKVRLSTPAVGGAAAAVTSCGCVPPPEGPAGGAVAVAVEGRSSLANRRLCRSRCAIRVVAGAGAEAFDVAPTVLAAAAGVAVAVATGAGAVCAGALASGATARVPPAARR